ncbi:type II toxin-antitoxin system VapC family toxin [Occultella glacieicola]|uniref:Ribonuclease VapC n=1 Tax=Occultella glacieicola TaxID=2518684 RepID=A0ABY2E3U7_9MICO|nr:type II toxin-antitoxin system VapC family toxin [Occultella glacieicola]
MAVDSSALVAIVLGEPEAEAMLRALQSQPAIVGAVTLVETSIVVEARQGPDATRDLDLLVAGAVDEVVAFERRHAREALEAWRRFGKGRHQAGLNYGDCLAYAVARVHDAPLLFKSEGFTKTDVPAVRHA